MKIQSTFSLKGFSRFELEGGTLFLNEQPPTVERSPFFLCGDSNEAYLLAVPRGVTPGHTKCVLLCRSSINCYKFAAQNGQEIRFGVAQSLSAFSHLMEAFFQ